MSRTPGPSEGFETKNGVYCLECREWKHEEPLEEEAADGPAPVPLVNGSHKAGEAPTIRIFGSPSPVQSNLRKACHKDGQPASASLGPVHSSKVSKPAVKKKPGPQR
jgi:hypothetical protein